MLPNQILRNMLKNYPICFLWNLEKIFPQTKEYVTEALLFFFIAFVKKLGVAFEEAALKKMKVPTSEGAA